MPLVYPIFYKRKERKMNNHSLNNKKILVADDVSAQAEKLSDRARATFDLIVKTAHDSFAEKGYELTSIKEIASNANLSVGLIYKYFSNKEELYRYIVFNEQQAIKKYISARIDSSKPRLEIEKEGLRAWLHYVLDNPNVYKLIWESLFFDKDSFDQYYHSFAWSYRKALAGAEEELSIEDIKNLAYIIIGANTFLGVRIIMAKSITDEEIDQMVETFGEIALKGFLKADKQIEG